jgi:hypothetical protein
VFLSCDPDIGWGIPYDGLGKLVGAHRVEQIGDAVLEHDQLLEEQARFKRAPVQERNALAAAGRPRYVALRLPELREVLGSALRDALAHRASQPEARQRCLRGGPETAFVSIAGRLGPSLPAWLDDDHGGSQVLRVCEYSGVVFRATCRARIHPTLKQPKRAQRERLRQGGSGFVTPRVGSLFPPADPFAPYALDLWSFATCAQCGTDFERRNAGKVYCDSCDTLAARQARWRAATHRL